MRKVGWGLIILCGLFFLLTFFDILNGDFTCPSDGKIYLPTTVRDGFITSSVLLGLGIYWVKKERRK